MCIYMHIHYACLYIYVYTHAYTCLWKWQVYLISCEVSNYIEDVAETNTCKLRYRLFFTSRSHNFTKLVSAIFAHASTPHK